MNQIKSLDELVEFVTHLRRKFKISVAHAQDPNTLGALAKAVELGFVEAFLYGNITKIREELNLLGVLPDFFSIIPTESETESIEKSLYAVKSGQADIWMKGLVNTDKFLKAVIDKEKGLLKPDNVLSYVCALQLPEYNKILFVSDTAVIPFPDLIQKISMIEYSLTMARQFGIDNPKVALISAVEKPSIHFQSTIDYSVICKLAQQGKFDECIIDGPLDVFLACNPKSLEIKGIDTPIKGEADILIFPSLEACNAFYKGLMLFGKGELAGLLQGTVKPVIVMSRSESAKSKFYCIALSCLQANEKLNPQNK